MVKGKSGERAGVLQKGPFRPCLRALRERGAFCHSHSAELCSAAPTEIASTSHFPSACSPPLFGLLAKPPSVLFPSPPPPPHISPVSCSSALLLFLPHPSAVVFSLAPAPAFHVIMHKTDVHAFTLLLTSGGNTPRTRIYAYYTAPRS